MEKKLLYKGQTLDGFEIDPKGMDMPVPILVCILM